MPTEAQIIAQIAALDGMGLAKSASLPNDDIVDYQLLNLAMLKAIEEKASSSSAVSYLAAALGRRNAATSLSVVEPRRRLVQPTSLNRASSAITYSSGQAVGQSGNNAQITIPNFFSEAVIGASVTIRKISLLRYVTTGTLAPGNYRIYTGIVSGIGAAVDATPLAPSLGASLGLQSIVDLNMTTLSPSIQYGEISLESSVISTSTAVDAFAAIVNLGTVAALALENYQLFYHLED
jgi:hypothetical protein